MGSRYFIVFIMEPADASRRPGRPRSFDRDTALHQAMLTFWQHGYETSSVADLTTAMGISTPSLYAAFGDKKQLFLETVRLYAGDPQATQAAVAAAASSLEAARDLLQAAACAYTGEATPRGCLLASATASGSAASTEVQHAVADIRRSVQSALRARIERDVSDHRLPQATDAAGLSGMVMAVMQGLSVLARDGADRASLLAIAGHALQAWPKQQEPR